MVLNNVFLAIFDKCVVQFISDMSNHSERKTQLVRKQVRFFSKEMTPLNEMSMMRLTTLGEEGAGSILGRMRGMSRGLKHDIDFFI